MKIESKQNRIEIKVKKNKEKRKSLIYCEIYGLTWYLRNAIFQKTKPHASRDIKSIHAESKNQTTLFYAACPAGTRFTAIADDMPASIAASASCTSRAAFWFNQLKYVCQPTAITPEKTLRYSGGTYMKLNAVTAGQSLTLLEILTGRAFFKRSQVSSKVAPARRECTLKK